MKNIVYPDYNNCILNLITSVLKYYQVETKYEGIKELDEILKKRFRNIVLIVLDGMGRNILNNMSPNGFFSKNKLKDITSVYPSTTTAALNTYYSGKPPIETGWIGWTQYFKEYGRAINMFPKTDAYTEEQYTNANMDVFDLIKYKNIYEQIEESMPNVKAYEIEPADCDRRANRAIKADTIEYMCDAIEAICKNTDNNFVLAYSESPDKILHKKGCESQEVKEFILQAEDRIQKLSEDLKGTNTLLIISADHGHNDIKKTYNILDLEELNSCLIMPPCIESRAMTFWVQEDKKKKFEKLFKETFKDEYILLTKEEFLNQHFLGYGTKHKKIDDFIGDYMALSTGDSIIKIRTYLSKEKSEKLSTHCGLTENEMIIPLITKEIK